MSLTEPPAAVLYRWLLETGQIEDPNENAQLDWTGIVGQMIDGDDVPDKLIAIIDIEGRTQGRLQKSGTTVEKHGVQIRSRAVTYRDGRSKLSAIAKELDKLHRYFVTVEGARFLINAATRGNILTLGQEEGNRRRWQFALTVFLSITEDPE